MLKLNIFIFICLYIFSIKEFEEDLVEGTKSFTLEKQKNIYLLLMLLMMELIHLFFLDFLVFMTLVPKTKGI